MSTQLVWELVKKNNAFLTKNVNGTVWSKEAGNLYNKNSYKYSGLANRSNFVGVTEVDGAVGITTASKKKAGKANTSIVKKNARRTAFAAGAVAGSVRPDLKKAAQARASALSRALCARKAAESTS